MARVKTFTNGGSLLPGDLNSIEDDYELAFSTYKTIWRAGFGSFGSSQAAGTFLFPDGGGTGGAQPLSVTLAFASQTVMYFDPADYTAGSRTTKYRVKATGVVVGSAGPATTITVGFYPVSSVSGGIPTLGSVVSGSTVAFASPAANSMSQGNSGDFTAPAAGFYVLGYVIAATTAASSGMGIIPELQVRQV